MKFEDIKSTKLTIEQLKKRQWTRGLPLSLIGCIVYVVLRLCGHKPKDYHGVCKYFEIGHGRYGFEMGWFFVCTKDASDSLKNHEVGHSIQNATVGGFKMLCYCMCSVLRYWFLTIFKPQAQYYSWWFETQATSLGHEFVYEVKRKNV